MPAAAASRPAAAGVSPCACSVGPYPASADYLASSAQSARPFRCAPLLQVEASIDYLKEHGLTGAAKAAADEVTAKLAEAKKLPGYLLHQVGGWRAALGRAEGPLWGLGSLRLLPLCSA